MNFSLYQAATDDPKPLGEIETIKRLSAAGFEVMDLGTGRANDPNYYLLVEDWQASEMRPYA